MPRRKSSSKSAEEAKPAVLPKSESSEPEEAQSDEAAPEETPERTEPPQRPLADLEPRLTAAQMFRGANDPIASAFLHVEKLEQKRVRKLTRKEWKDAFEKFRAAERR